ncbi:MAG TPA: hypothetical protein VFB49_04555 [Patescibacteria group bacterium]|nr:hypothetical protein [Patescibacteria group bacterium]
MALARFSGWAPIALVALVAGISSTRPASSLRTSATPGPPSPEHSFKADHRDLSIHVLAYRDLDGDHDGFPDTGETGRLVLAITNARSTLQGVYVNLTTTDPGVACIIDRSVFVGTLPHGQPVTVGSLDPAQPGFTFKVSDTLQTVSPTSPAALTLCLEYASSYYSEFSDPICFSLTADLDLPAGGGTLVPGPDGVTGTPDDGTVVENFDVDRDGDGNETINDTFRAFDDVTGQIVHGSYLRGAAVTGPGTVSGVTCGGFQTFEQGNPACQLDPDYPMDWHLHCPPGATNCPNLETGLCVGNCSYQTNDGQRATSPPNSLHMAAHWNVLPGESPDVTHFRTLQGFVMPPMNLTGQPRPGDLQLSFFQIASLMDDHWVSTGRNGRQCSDCGQVQIQIDTDPAPDHDLWGFWDVLVPYQNTYDHTALSFSSGSDYYCNFTPTDTGAAPPNPNGFHETFCHPQQSFASCGSVNGTTPGTTYDCVGPGVVDPTGTGVWVESKFDLTRFLGQRVKIRWIAETWTWGAFTSSYYELGSSGGWTQTTQDDGWWLDDIEVTGLVTRQSAPVPDTRPSPGSACPAALCVDADGDGYYGPAAPPCPAGVPLDCDDTNLHTHPSADEYNDGADNQCPGEPGHGLADELTYMEFDCCSGPGKYFLFLPFQQGAYYYDLARSLRKDFSGDCILSLESDTVTSVSELPPLGQAYYYLVRTHSPYAGSWGADSAGHERTGVCGL